MPKISDVDIVNPLWHGDILNRYHALLVGGHVFASMKNQFLFKKPSESPVNMTRVQPNSGIAGGQMPLSGYYMPSAGGIDQYQYRLNKSSYKPTISSLFGYLASKIFPDNPEIKTTDENILGLLDDADEFKRPLILICREALINALTYSISDGPSGAYIQMYANEEGIIKLNVANNLTVVDWDDEEQPNWVRTKSISPMRSKEYGPVDKEKWTWRIYNGESVTTYSGERKCGGYGKPQKIDGPSVEDHQLGRCPFIRINLSSHQYLMDQMAPSIVEQFNLESDISSFCGKISNAQLIIKTNQKDLPSIVIPPLGVIMLDPADDAKYESPNPASCNPLFQHRTALRDSIYNSINSSVMRAAADFVQNPRQSATAKEMDLEPWSKWSQTFSQPIKSAIAIAIETMANFYGIDVPEIVWQEPLAISESEVKDTLGMSVEEPNGKETDESDESSAD
jgi:hypothetical protein